MKSLDRLAHESRFRRWPLADKALLSLGLLALALALPPLPAAPLVWLAATGYARASGLSLRAWFKLQMAPAGFLAASLLVLAFPFDAASIATGLTVSARALAAAACMLALAVTAPVAEIAAGLGRLGLPGPLVDLVTASYRFAFLLWAEAATMHAAQAARLGQTGWRLRLRSLSLLTANLLPRALHRAQRLERGLTARGWTGDGVRWRPERPRSPGRTLRIAGVLLLVGLAGGLTA